MAGFGGTIKLTGESQYRAALSNIAAQLRSVGTQMKVVTAASTGNEKSLTNLTAKNNVLGSTLDLHKQKLSVLGEQYKKLQEQQAQNKEKSAQLAEQLGNEQAKLADIAVESGRGSEEYQKQSGVVARLTAAYNKSQTAIIKTETAMSKCTAQMHTAELGIVKTQQALDALAPDLQKAEKETLALGRQYDLTGKIAGVFKSQIAAIKGVIPGMVSGVKNAATSVKNLATNMANSVKSVGTFVSSTKQAAAAASGFKGKVGAVASSIGGAMANGINTAAGSVVRLVDHFKSGSTAATEMGEAAAKSGKDAESGSGGYTILKNVVANLATSAIQSAIGGLKQLGAAVMDVGKQAIEAYSQNEQLVGGVQTLFKDSAGTVLQYANDAYQAAGMSANEYMDTITGFSASLINSLGGDTKAAADLGNTAVQDMADNANKMGTDIGTIQETYQSLARGNYAMLDNLKLGVAGTKAGMADLMAKAEQLTGEHYTVGDFGDTVKAIHAVQESMGITGTTAKEASTTIEGSMNTMKAAWTNLLAGLSDPSANLGQLLGNLVDSANTAANNIIKRIPPLVSGIGSAVTALLPEIVSKIEYSIVPLIKSTLPTIISAVQSVMSGLTSELPLLMSALSGLIPTIISGLLQLLPDVVSAGATIINGLLDGIMQAIPQLLTMLPQLVSAGMQMLMSLLNGIVEALPQLIAMLPTIITQIVTIITTNLPQILSAGMQILMALVNGIVASMPQLIEMLPTIINQVVGTLMANLPMIVGVGVQLLGSLINGLVKAIPQLVAMLPTIITQTVDTLIANLPLIIEAGVTILISLIEGLTEAMPQLVAMLPTIVMQIVSTLSAHLPEIISTGLLMMVQLAVGIVKGVANVVKGAGEIVESLFNAFKEVPGKMMEIGGNIIQGLWKGLEKAKDWLKEKISSIADWIPGWIKDKLGIHSPSRVMRDQVGKYIAEGIGVGFEDEMSSVRAQMLDAMPSPDAFANDYSFGSVSAAQAASSGYRAGGSQDIVSAITEALKGVQVVLDDEVAGRFVTKTVTAAIYR